MQLTTCIAIFVAVMKNVLGIEIPDNQGKEFIIGYMEASTHLGQISNKSVDLFITTSSSTPVYVEISTPKNGNNDKKIIVSQNKVEHVQLRKELRLLGNMRCNNGVLIKGSKEIIVFGLNVALLSTDGFMALPVDVLGTKYIVPAYRNNANFVNYSKSAILVVGVEDNTNLSIQLSEGGNVEVEVDRKKYHDGDWINTTINRFETLQIVTSGDLTGTFVHASSPVSVFGGSTVTSVGPGNSYDHVEEHIPPVNVWGKTFFINPIPKTDDNFLRFLSSQDNTELRVNNNKYVLQKSGHFIETRLHGFSVVTSNKPILPVLYVPSQTKNYSGDPAMALIPPREQFNSFYSFATPVSSRNTNFSTVFVFVIETKHKNGIVLDGRPVLMSQIKGLVHHDNFSAGYLEIPPGSHILKHSSVIAKFSGILFGGAYCESYCFPVGQRFTQINEVCHPKTMAIGDGLDNDCDNDIDEEICFDNQDNDNDGRMDEDCLTAISTTARTTISRTTITTAPVVNLTNPPTTSVYTKESTRLSTTTVSGIKLHAIKQSTELITTTTARTIIRSIQPMTTLSSPNMETIQITTKRSAFDKGPEGGMSLSIFSSNAPFWYRFSLYAVLGCVAVVIIGLLSVCCKKCWAALAKRDDDDDDEEERKKYKEYNNRRFRAPRVKPLRVMTMQNI